MHTTCLVWYGGFNRANVQDKGFRGWHWLILLEQTPTEVIVHDPDYFDKRRNEGSFKRYSLAEWNAAFIPYYAYSSTKRTVVVLDQ